MQTICSLVGKPVLNGKGGGQLMRSSPTATPTRTALSVQQVRYWISARAVKTFKARRPGRNGEWVHDLKNVRRVLYRLPQVLKAELVFVVEGEKDVHSLESLGLTATTNPLGAGKWLDDHSDSLKGKDVVILPDNDEAGRNHAEHVKQSLTGKARSIVVVALPVQQEKADVTDWKEAGGTREAIEALVEAARRQAQALIPAPDSTSSPATSEAQPRGFRMTPEGLIREQDSGPDLWICQLFEVLSRTRDSRNEDWGREIRFKDPDGVEHTTILSDALLAGDRGEWRQFLLRQGFKMSHSPKASAAQREYLFRIDPAARSRRVPIMGWHNHQGVFITPGWSVPAETPERIILDHGGEAHNFKRSGTLEEWRQSVSAPSRGNALLQFSICAAFAPPLLPFKHGMGGGFHFASDSTTGKSTALIVAGSAWGGGGKNGFGHSWKMTANGAEALGLAHNHCLLLLDELAELRDKERAGDLAYFFSHGETTARMNKDLKSRNLPGFSLLFLSSGEFGFLDLVRRHTGRTYTGQEVRICEIPADSGKHGIFDDLHGSQSPGEFAESMKAAALRFYGTAAPVFLEKMIEAGASRIREKLDELMGSFSTALRSRRCARSCPSASALRVRGGVRRTRHGMGHYRLEPGEAANGWHAPMNSGSDGGHERIRQHMEALDHLRDYIRRFRASRFQRHQSGSPTVSRTFRKSTVTSTKGTCRRRKSNS